MNGFAMKIIYIMEWVKRIFSYGKRRLPYLWHKYQYAAVDVTTYIMSPIVITPRYLRCGKNVYVGAHARLEGVSKYNDICFTPLIVLEDGVSIQQNLHLTCANCIIIGQNTAIAANVTITDIHHPYDEISKPIEKQNIKVGFVRIGADCKIYNNAVILPNVTLGRHVTIGANSVVNHDIPDYCVAVGNPVRIVKRYDFDKKEWRRTDLKGNFI